MEVIGRERFKLARFMMVVLDTEGGMTRSGSYTTLREVSADVVAFYDMGRHFRMSPDSPNFSMSYLVPRSGVGDVAGPIASFSFTLAAQCSDDRKGVASREASSFWKQLLAFAQKEGAGLVLVLYWSGRGHDARILTDHAHPPSGIVLVDALKAVQALDPVARETYSLPKLRGELEADLVRTGGAVGVPAHIAAADVAYTVLVLERLAWQTAFAALDGADRRWEFALHLRARDPDAYVAATY